MTGYGEYFYSNGFNYFGEFEEGKKHVTGLINITKFNSKNFTIRSNKFKLNGGPI